MIMLDRLPSGCQGLDLLLGGGFESGIITQIYGGAGTGKTSLAKAMGAESGKLTIMVNLGAFQSKYQGESFANVKSFIKLIKALGDCLLIFDEFEKQFAGTSGSGELDSGVKKGMGSLWLDFFPNRPPNVYIVTTFNSLT